MCPVCYRDELCGAYLPCGHGLCRRCASLWFMRSSTCPTCRAPIGVEFGLGHFHEELTKLRRLVDGYECNLHVDILIHEGGITSFKKNPLLKDNDDVQSAD